MHTSLLLLSLLAPPEGGSGGLSVLMFQMVLIGGVFYLLLIRPQSKARKQHAQMVAALKRGDEVTTSGGVLGKVRDLKDDRITIESGESTLVVQRSSIVRVGDQAVQGPGGA